MTDAGPSIAEFAEWSCNGRWQGEIEGQDHAVGASLIINDFVQPGMGPDLHRHDYAETIIVLAGKALATVGDEQHVIQAGQIVYLPARVPHAFKSLPGEPFRAVDIHENPRFVTEWLGRI